MIRARRKSRFNQNIAFGDDDLIGLASTHDDALVVGNIADFDIKRVLVDGGSATNVLI